MTFKNPFVPGSTENPAIDALWVFVCTFIVFTMQTGFGLLECGTVRSRTEANVFVRCAIDLVVGGTAYWSLGYGLSYGDKGTSFSGTNHFFLDGVVEEQPSMYIKFFFQFAFAAAATTIVSGAVTERIRLKQYIIFVFINTGFIYPIIAHWLWDEKGWLKKLGAYDFAGGCVVHVTGGTAAVVGAIILGPREGRFDKANEDEYRPSKPINILIGTFLLWFGWIGFNCGSTFGVTGGMWKITASVAVVTTLGACGGGIGVIFLSFFLERRRKHFLDVGQFASGILAGLVAVTAMASQARPAEGFIVGLLGGLLAIGVTYLMEYLHVDDPVGCFGIHWAAGAFGMIAVGCVAERDKIIGLVSRDGLFRSGGPYLLGVNLLAVLSVTLFSAVMSAICFWVMHYTIGLRLSVEEEAKGADFVEHAINPIILPIHMMEETTDTYEPINNEGDHLLDSFNK